MGLVNFITGMRNRRRWRRLLKVVLYEPVIDLRKLEDDIYMYREAKAWRRALVQAKSVLLSQVDGRQPRIATLQQARHVINGLLEDYRSLPWNEGDWECAALCRLLHGIDEAIARTPQ